MSESQRPSSHNWWIGVFAAASLSAGVAAWMKLGNGAHQQAEGSVDSRSATSAAAEPPRGALFPRGIEQTYDIDEMTDVATSNGQPLAGLELHGQLRLTALEVGARVRLRGEFTGTVQLKVGSELEEDPAATRGALQPFLLDYASDGTFSAAHGAPDTPQVIARTWTALGENLQVLRAGSSMHWERLERDNVGVYTAAYDQRSPSELVKQKLAYKPLAQGFFEAYEVLRSKALFTLDKRGALEAFTLDEATQAHSSEGAPLPTMHGTVDVALHRTDSREVDLEPLLAQTERTQPLDAVQQQMQTRALDEARSAGFTIAQAISSVAALNDLDGSREAHERAGRAYVALIALLRRYPEALRTVRDHLMQQGPLSNIMLGALADASTPETQALLADLASEKKSPFPVALRIEAARDMSRIQTPTPATIEALKSMRSDSAFGVQGTYGLGSALRRLNQIDPGLADNVRDTLSTQLSEAKTDGERSAVLKALGNAGDTSFVETIRGYAISRDDDVRAAAAQAVRRIPGEEVEPLLVQACADSALNVRASAVDAISERAASPTLAGALAGIAVGDNSFNVRAQALNVLVKWLPDRPEISDSLALVAKNDENSDLRRIAQSALDEAATKSP